MSETASGEACDSTLSSGKEILQAFNSPGDHVATFETDELTALCPFDFGGPDFYTLTLRYRPKDAVVESRSLKEYVQAFRSVEASAEEIAVNIHADITAVVDPKACYVRVEQSRRGGIEETVEVGNDPH